MKKFFLYFLTPLVFCSSICLAQTENNSPLMMMRLGGEPHEGADPHESTLQKSQEERRAEEAQDSSADHQATRGSVIHASESQETAAFSSETTQNDDTAIRDFKSHQVQLVTSKIDFLKTNHPYQIDLISLLESYLQKYEAVLDLRTFNEWRTDVLMQEKQSAELEQPYSSTIDTKEAKQCSLKLLLCEHEILNALLTEPVPLERAQAYSRIRSIHTLSKDAFESARRQLELKSQHDISIDEYIRTETEYSQAKKTYYSKVEEVKSFYSIHLNPNALKDIIPPSTI